VYQEFIDENIKEDQDGYIKWTELLNVYSNWLDNNYKKKIDNPKNVKKMFVDKLFKIESY
jgi:hypothetical protein